MKSLELKLHTEDGIEVAGTYIPGSLPFGVVFLHAMPATKDSYAEFAEKVAEAGFHTLAIDFRGHGVSGGGNWESFGEEDHQKYILDLDSAVKYLNKQNPEIKILVVGGSIGANIAVQYATKNALAGLILLSPGVNYRGVNAGEMIGMLPEDLPVYFASALDDERVPGNAAQTETLYNSCSSRKKSIQIFKTGGHAADILKNNPAFQENLLDFMNLLK